MATQPDESGLACSNAVEGHAAHPFDPADGVEDADLLNSCTVCGGQTHMTCPGCATRYCSRECLKTDWVHHKALCQTLKNDFEASNGPKNYIRAIVFPVNSNKPSWVWIHLKALDLSIIRALGITAKKPLKKAVNKLAVQDINKSLRHRKIGRGIRQFTAPNARHEESHINESIVALASIGSLKTYFGSAIFLAFRTVEAADGAIEIQYDHASCRDLRMIIEWYCTRYENPCVSAIRRLPIKSYGEPGEETALLPAVKIYCDGDLYRFSQLADKKLERTENVQVLAKDYLGQRTVSIFASLAGLPWLSQLCHGTDDAMVDDGIKLFNNPIGRYYAPEEPGYFRYCHGEITAHQELIPYLKLYHCGTILVIHKDGCLIREKHIDCFVQFVRWCFREAARIETGDGKKELCGHDVDADVGIDIDYCMELMSREKFELFWQRWITDELGEEAAPLFPSPYNTINKVERDPVPSTAGKGEVMEVGEKVERLDLEES